MKCKDCEWFKVAYMPLRVGRDVFDSGRAVCEKHDLVCDFNSANKLNRLECVERGESE